MLFVCLYMADSDVRLTAEWTTQADERIMEWLKDAGTHPSSAIGHRLNQLGVEYTRPHISRRCKKLSEYGLLEKNYQNYSITEKGELFLNGELDLSTLKQGEGHSSE